MNEQTIEEGIPLTPEDEFWMSRMREMAADSVNAVQEAARQLIAMITVMEGIYAAVLAFSGIKQIPQDSVPAVIFYASPILLWLVSLFFALRVFVTRKYHYFGNSPDSSAAAFQKIAEFKYHDLKRAYFFLCLSFAVAAGGIMYWLYTRAG